MRLAGLQKLTLLDYPGEVACTVFTKGCNLRCPFCQNPDLVLPQFMEESGTLPEEEFFRFLDRRRGRLSGVAVTGGEPTLQEGLAHFLGRIREMGFLVKLDTNGLNPKALETIVRKGLVDYVAMDVKNCPGKYALTAGLEERHPGMLWETASESIRFLMEDHVPCEFRTTVAAGLHTEEDIVEMARHLQGARAWFLQQFLPAEHMVGDYPTDGSGQAAVRCADAAVRRLRPPSAEELRRMRDAAAAYVPSVSVRGI